MKTSKKRLSRQKHAHKQRKQVLLCHHAPPSYNHSSLSEAVWIHGYGALMHYQVHSDTLRFSLKRSASILVQPSSTTPMAPRLDALLRFPSSNPPALREEPLFSTFLRFCDTNVTFSLNFQRKVTSSIPYATERRDFFYFSFAEAM